MKASYPLMAIISTLIACAPAAPRVNRDFIPAEEFSRAVKQGAAEEYSFHRLAHQIPQGPDQHMLPEASALPAALTAEHPEARAQFRGDPRLMEQGWQLKDSVGAPPISLVQHRGVAPAMPGHPPVPPTAMPPAPPPGSSAPYMMGQMTANPSLWPDEGQGASLFTDHRAMRAMDLITIVINENNRGKKKAETETDSKFDLIAGVSKFFGVETKKWAANNTALDPSQLISASTQTGFTGEGETEREGTLSGRISAVIMEVLPNGLLRVEGTKIISINEEEEVLVVSGLVRLRDINSRNEVDSSRVANVRIDFYGRGVLADNQAPGWGAKIFKLVWPF